MCPSGLIWRCHVDQLCAASPGITNNSKSAESLIDVPPIVRDQITPDSLFPASVPSASHSTFAVRQRRPPDRYGTSSPSD